jgi:hypothetical protein
MWQGRSWFFSCTSDPGQQKALALCAGEAYVSDSYSQLKILEKEPRLFCPSFELERRSGRTVMSAYPLATQEAQHQHPYWVSRSKDGYPD